MSGENQEAPVVKARGLPWSATEKDVTEFFSDVNIVNGENGIHFTYTKDGRPSGECFLEVTTFDDLQKAIAHNNEHMGKRYIEVMEAKHSEMEWVVNRMNPSSQDGDGDGVVRLRGLPFGCSKQDIAAFFQGLQISPYGITITMDQDGRASGDAYVEFATQDDADRALLKHKEKIGHRYIEIFKSSKADIKYVVVPRQDMRPSLMNLRPGPYDRPMGGDRFGGGFNSRARGRGGMNLGPSGFNSGSNYGSNYDYNPRGPRGGKGGAMRGGRQMGGGMGGMNKMVPQNSKTGHSVHMRGLPFEATVNDVLTFFAPVNPVDVRLLYEPNSGRPKGECDVDFATHADAEAAMQKDKQNMGHRYIELFIKSTPNGNSWNTGPSPMNRGGPMQGGYGGNSGGNGPMSGGGNSGYNNNNMGMNSLMGGNNGPPNYNFKSFGPDQNQMGYQNQGNGNYYGGMR